jgi:hypothetical protein
METAASHDILDEVLGKPSTVTPPSNVTDGWPMDKDMKWKGRTWVKRKDGVHLVLPPID